METKSTMVPNQQQSVQDSSFMSSDIQSNSVHQETAEHAQNPALEVSDLVKSKVESYNIDGAIAELEKIIHESAELYHDLKKVKFNYLVQTCELYSRIDFPSIMMETCRKEVNQNVPPAKNINKMEF